MQTHTMMYGNADTWKRLDITAHRAGDTIVGTVAVDGTLQPVARFGTYPCPDGRWDTYPEANYDDGAETADPEGWVMHRMMLAGIEAADR